jgi:hypothetical protein
MLYRGTASQAFSRVKGEHTAAYMNEKRSYATLLRAVIGLDILAVEQEKLLNLAMEDVLDEKRRVKDERIPINDPKWYQKKTLLDVLGTSFQRLNLATSKSTRDELEYFLNGKNPELAAIQFGMAAALPILNVSTLKGRLHAALFDPATLERIQRTAQNKPQTRSVQF